MNINAGAIKRLKAEIQEMKSCMVKGFNLEDWLKCRIDLLEYLEADSREAKFEDWVPDGTSVSQSINKMIRTVKGEG